MLEWYMDRIEINPSSELYLFRGIVKTKEGERLHPSGSLGYSTTLSGYKGRCTRPSF